MIHIELLKVNWMKVRKKKRYIHSATGSNSNYTQCKLEEHFVAISPVKKSKVKVVSKFNLTNLGHFLTTTLLPLSWGIVHLKLQRDGGLV